MGALKLFTGDVPSDLVEPAAGANRRGTVREAYLEQTVAMAAVSSATHRNYLQAVAWWETLSSNPPLENLRQADVTAFRSDLQSHFPATTANKHLRSLRAILNRLGPPTARYPDAPELLSRVPFVKLLPETDPRPVHFSDDELTALWEAARFLNWPRVSPTKPVDWWRGLLVFGVSYGPRVGDLLGLDRENIYDGDGGRWIRWTSEKTEKVHAWPMTAATERALCGLGCRPSGLLLPCPNNPAKLYSTFRAWCAAAGIHRADPLSFHALRSTAAKRYDAVQRGLGSVILGHAVEANVTNKHYLGDAALADAYAAIRTISQPAKFIEG